MEKKPGILVADSDNENFHLIEDTLLALGYQVTLARTAEEIITKALQTPTDVLLLDLSSIRDGLEAVRRLKKAETTRLIPVVVMTAPDRKEDRLLALEAGADDF